MPLENGVSTTTTMMEILIKIKVLENARFHLWKGI